MGQHQQAWHVGLPSAVLPVSTAPGAVAAAADVHNQEGLNAGVLHPVHRKHHMHGCPDSVCVGLDSVQLPRPVPGCF